MIGVLEICGHIDRYLRGEESIKELRDWQVGADLESEIPEKADSHARILLAVLEAHFAELGDGVIDRLTFDILLSRLLPGKSTGTVCNGVVEYCVQL